MLSMSFQKADLTVLNQDGALSVPSFARPKDNTLKGAACRLLHCESSVTSSEAVISARGQNPIAVQRPNVGFHRLRTCRRIGSGLWLLCHHLAKAAFQSRSTYTVPNPSTI